MYFTVFYLDKNDKKEMTTLFGLKIIIIIVYTNVRDNTF